MSNQLKDKDDVYTTYGVFKNIEEDLARDVSKLKNTSRRKITYSEFRRVVGLYFKFVMLDLIDGKRFRLYNRFGELRLAKREMDKFLPNVRRVRTVDGKKISERVSPMEYIKKFGHYWYYLNWDVFKKWRTHELKQGKRFRDTMMAKAERGFDYIDYTPRYKGEGMVRKIK